MLYTTIDSPIGELMLVGDGETLHHLSMQGGRRPLRRDPAWTREDGAFTGLVEQLEEYFTGARRAFDVPLSLGGNPFEQRVWRALLDIPYGETTSYGEIARRIGSPDAPRAVGLANGRNPVAVIVPCHRVIGADGSLTGYAGGMWRKEWLLTHEGYALDARVLSRSRDGRPAP